MKMMIDIQMFFKKIKDFKSLEIPVFNDKNEDAFRYIIWNLYHRVSEAIKSYVVLFENGRYYDSFIIAGHCLETCAILSYIKDNPTPELCRERYNKYFASALLERLKYNLGLSDNLDTDLAKKVFIDLLKLFYPVGINIVKKNGLTKEQYEEAINKINSKLVTNKERINLLNNYYSKVRVSDYIKSLLKNTSHFGGEQFDKYYQKYCDVKHGNMMTPGASFEHNPFDCFAEDEIMLILGIMYYLKDFKF